MKYPIDTKKYIQAMRIAFGEDKNAEEAHRVIIPFINDCYKDGLRGESWYPMDLDAECAGFAMASGKSPESIKSNPLIPRLIAWCNSAYEAGREEAGKYENQT